MGHTVERRPAARASAARDNLANVDVFRPGSLAKIRALIPPESLDALDNTPGISWLDFEHDHWLMDGAIEVLGREDAIRCWRQGVTNLVETPLLRNFVQGALRLFGARPGKLLKMLPKGWSLGYRDFCVPRFRMSGPQSAEICFEDIAPQAFESEGYIHCWHGLCLGIFDLEKPSDPRVTFEIDRGASCAIASFRWA